MPPEAGDVSISAEDPAGESAQQLLAAMCEELTQRYGTAASPFSAIEAQAARTTFLVARVGSEAVGCAALRRLDDTTAEIKRMYVAPAGRRRGVARRLLADLEQRAEGFGYQVVRLETGKEQPEAISLYESAGYQRIPAFGHYIGNSVSVCFEKTLASGMSNAR